MRVREEGNEQTRVRERREEERWKGCIAK